MNARKSTLAWLSAPLLLAATAPALAQDIKTEGTFVSTVGTGTPPIQVDSTTIVSNLNADRLDGLEASAFALKSDVIDDGSLEINQECAVNAGCFNGDAAGFPVTITAATPAGKFRVTTDLDLGEAGADQDTLAVDVQTNGKIIDLGGNTISGTGATSPSSTENDGIGIETDFRAMIANGTVLGMAGHGIRCAGNCEIFNVRVVNNNRNGIETGSSSKVRNVEASSNTNDGIVVSQGSLVTESIATGNGGDGIRASAAGVNLFNNVADNNGGDGIEIFTGIARHNTAFFNDAHQINATSDAAIEGNQMRNSDGAGTLSGGIETGENVCNFSLCTP